MGPMLAVNLKNAPPEWKLAQPVYVEALKDVPIDLIQRAVMDHIRRSPWFPKPAELFELCSDALEHRRWRLREITEEIVAPMEPQPIPTEEQKASVDAMMSAQFGEERVVERRERPPPEDVAEAIRRAADGLRYFRLPDENDPMVQEWMRKA